MRKWLSASVRENPSDICSGELCGEWEAEEAKIGRAGGEQGTRSDRIRTLTWS